MGARGEAESVSQVLVAFLEHSTWSQAELGRRLGVQTRTVVNALNALKDAGVPFEVEREPPHVYWSVARDWFPTGVLMPTERAANIARLLARMPRSSAREVALRALLGALPSGLKLLDDVARVEPAEEVSAEVLTVLEDAAATHTAARVRYSSLSSGESDDRHVSIHRFSYGRFIRFAATCHRSGQLKWWRASRVERATLDPAVGFRTENEPTVDAWVAESWDGYRTDGVAEQHACFVRNPEARWVKRNLPDGTGVETTSEGVRLVWRAAAVEPIARFVLGLGGAATCETSSLRERVLQLAHGALAANGAQDPQVFSTRQDA